MNRGLQRIRSSGWIAGFLAGGVLALAVVFVNFSPDAQSAPPEDKAAPVAAGGVSFADVVERVSPAVVNIAVSKIEQATPTAGLPGFRRLPRGDGSPLDEFFGRFFELPDVPNAPQRRSEGLGSGFVIDASGYIVTNNHVVDGADKIVATLQDGRKLDATLVGRDPKTDLALLKVDASGGLPNVEFGNSDAARVGDWVLAIGNPFGLGGSATAGIISARARDIQSGPYDDYLQIDAPINSGNSGGPVFNDAGEVVGVNTAIFSPNGGNIGIGFAIPSNQAKSVIAELRSNGAVERGWLGVTIQSVDEEMADALGLETGDGALVAEVIDDGPAAHAGVMVGDVIKRFGSQDIDSAKTLSRVVAASGPSDTVTMKVWREGKTRDLRVKLGNAGTSDEVADTAPASAEGSDALGLALQTLTDEDKARLGVPSDTSGAFVARVAPDSVSAEKGIRPGDVIVQVNHKNVESAGAAAAALRDAQAQRSRALLLVRRGDSQHFVALSFS